MRKILLSAVCILICASCLIADDGYQSGITNILHKLSSIGYRERMSATNSIDLLMLTQTNNDHIAECKLLKAIALLECAEIEHDNSLCTTARNLCESVKSDYSCCPSGWRFMGACLIEMQALAQKEEYAQAYSLATNVIAFAPLADFERSTNIWCALFGADIPTQISLRDAFKVNAAEALLSMDRASDITALTNGLPPRAMEKIAELLVNP